MAIQTATASEDAASSCPLNKQSNNRSVRGLDIDTIGEGSKAGRGGNSETIWVDEDENSGEDHPPLSSPSIISKYRFSALESDSLPTTTPGGSTLISHASSSTSSKREQITGAIALTNIGHGFADYNSIYRRDVEQREAQRKQCTVLAAPL